MLFLTFFILSFLRFALGQDPTTQDVSSCSCGFYDVELDMVFTDTTIIYFNETDIIPEDLVVESFEHKYDRGWNALYRQGAAIENVGITNDTSARDLQGLAVYCNPTDDSGLVVGASVRTARQDIFFGSFRTSMRAPRQWLDGSALSMVLQHNQTEAWDIDVMNTDNSSVAWVSMLSRGEFSDLWLGKNFTDLIAAGMNPWYYTEYRVDWTRDRIDYYIGGVLMQSTIKEINGTLPSTPAPLRWQHWSLGNPYNTQGPPGIRSQANIGWSRLFFNSSLTTKEDQAAFDQRCTPEAACRMEDNTLRGSSAIPPESLHPWKQFQPKWTVPWIPLTIDIIFLALAVLFTSKSLSRRVTRDKIRSFFRKSKQNRAGTPSSNSMTTTDSELVSEKKTDGKSRDSSSSTEGESRNLPREPSYVSFMAPPTYSGVHTPAPEYQSPRASQGPTRVNSEVDLTITPAPLPRTDSVGSNLYMKGSSLKLHPPMPLSALIATGQSKDAFHTPSSSSSGSLPRIERPDAIQSSTPRFPPSVALASAVDIPELVEPIAGTGAIDNQAATAVGKTSEIKVTAAAAGEVAAAAGPPKQQRVDYLAGFIAFSAILVTFNHFGLTFWAAVIIPSVRPHYSSETWARKTFATFFLDPLWIGPFLMISTRFLTSNYLRTGNLGNMAQKIVARPFRLLIPVASIATLEYFLMDAGALQWLEFLPSVTWSPWPFTSIVENPGVFMSEIIQLAYLIPNAAPMITYNYCTGVLWTIPVQLQGAWQTLLALIMVRECKTPWKRFAFYAFCISQHWYGQSWGSYYYAGVLLADLDLTFKYKEWLHPRPLAYYPLLWLLIALALGGFTLDAITQWTGVNYAEVEYGWHPDTSTGLSISQAGKSVYPDYFIPRLNALITTVAMQMVVEISPALQKVLSIKPLQWLFPHVFSIYLIHGFIFWSVGSWAMVSIFSYGAPYWLCVLLTFIICYGTLFASLPLLTPPIELLGKKLTLSIWENASQEPAPRKPTTYPFGTDLLKRDIDASRSSGSGVSESSMEEKRENPFSDPVEKGKGAMRVNEEAV
ncbi:hypothetical protein LSUE1_G001622 [Lachnellula suecica]|uniref:GH16 domain-containing protein n=1 Tax=Lachnellula suecica TaxID=602035 RepID=A0A8T9CMC7_9HELO|nr:hypothetical protein LSUE1_G001622 [Lachnellula suecica]